MDQLEESKYQKIRSELKPGESIVWTGQPDSVEYMKSSILGFLFFIPWTAFSVFWIAFASGLEIPDFSKGGFAYFPLFGLPFLLIGIWGLSSPLREKLKAKNVIYAITTQRVIIIEGFRSTTYRSYYPAQLKNIEKVQKSNAFGSIYFQLVPYIDANGGERYEKVRFIGIPNVQAVENKIINLANGNA